MAQFVVNAQRLDPYKAFMFRVMWDKVYVAGVSKVSALKRSTTPVVHRDGGDPAQEHKSPGITKWEAVTLERGITFDKAFADWAGLVHSVSDPIKLSSFRKDIIIDVLTKPTSACSRTSS